MFIYIFYVFQTVIANVMNNSKEILKLLLTMSGYITSTLTMCEKLTASTTTVRLSSVPDGSKEYFNTFLLNIKDLAT